MGDMQLNAHTLYWIFLPLHFNKRVEIISQARNGRNSSEIGICKAACWAWLLEPLCWHGILFLSCTIRKPIIANMCCKSSLALRVPLGVGISDVIPFLPMNIYKQTAFKPLYFLGFFFFFMSFQVYVWGGIFVKARIIRAWGEEGWLVVQ